MRPKSGRTIVAGCLAAIVAANSALAADDEAYNLAVGRSTAHAYAVGVGISMLAKIHLLPDLNLDFSALITEDSAQNMELLKSGAADLGMIDQDDLAPGANGGVDVVAKLWRSDQPASLLAVRHEVDSEAVYQLTKVIFENLPFLHGIDEITSETTLDGAVADLPLRLHPGAERYYRELEVLTTPVVAENRSAAPEPQGEQQAAQDPVAPREQAPEEPPPQEQQALIAPPVIDPPPAKTFVVYFDSNQAALDEESQETMDALGDFVGELESARAWVSGYTDSAGSADYNLDLAERRVEAVTGALREFGLGDSIEVTIFGERSPWVLTNDDTKEARNRRVEILVEELEPLPGVQPSALPPIQPAVKSGALITPAVRSTEEQAPKSLM